MLRENLCTNPSFEAGLASWFASSGTVLHDGGYAQMEGRAGLYMARVTAAPSVSPYLTYEYGDSAGAGGVALAGGEWVGVRGWIATEGPPIQARGRLRFRSSGGIYTYADSGWTSAKFYSGIYVTIVTQAPADAIMVQQAAQIFSGDTGVNVPGGTRMWTDAWTVATGTTEQEVNDLLGLDYFDGDTPDDGAIRRYWTGTPHASTSVETRPDITATILTASQPSPVQLVISDVPDGMDAVVVGTTARGDVWPVPGGQFTSTGAQVVLTDNRAPLNVPVTYIVRVVGQEFAAEPVTVEYHADHLIQSLDGRTVVDFKWLDNAAPRSPEVRTVAFSVPGRARPPMRVIAGGPGGGSYVIRTDRENSERLNGIAQAGQVVVVRTNGAARDIPASDLLLITAAPNQLWGAGGGISDHRVWDLSYIFAPDPDPTQPLVAFDWDDFDAAMATAAPTWDDFDALAAANFPTWNDFDAVDWGQWL